MIEPRYAPLDAVTVAVDVQYIFLFYCPTSVKI